MMKQRNKILSIVLVFVMLIGTSIPAFAGNSIGVTYSISIAPETLTVSTSDQYVTMEINANSVITYDTIGAKILRPDPIEITAIENKEVTLKASEYNCKMPAESDAKQRGSIGFDTSDGEDSTITNICKVTYKIPAGTPAGEYTLGIEELTISKEYGTVWEDEGTVTKKLTVGTGTGSSVLGGSVSISGAAIFGQSLTANTSALNYGSEGLGTLSYQWNRNGTAITGANSASYTLTADDIGKTITVTVKNSKNSGSITSTGIGPVEKKVCPSTPSPAIVSKTSNSVTVTNVISGQEYAITTGTSEPDSGWNTIGKFIDLTANTVYHVYARIAETATVKASFAHVTDVTTDKLEQTISAPDSKNMSFNTSLDLNTLCSVNASGNTLTYTQVTAPPAGTTFNASSGIVTAGTAAGSFKVKVSAAAYGDYKAAEDKEITINIVSLPTQVFAAGFNSAVYKTYGDPDFTKTATLTTGNGTITYESSKPSAVAVDPTTGKVTIKKVSFGTGGGYEPVIITATAAETTEYAETSVSYPLTVYVRTIEIEWHDYENRVYGDGKTVTATVKNKVGDDDVELMVANGNKTNAGGPYTATACRTGADDINYKLPSVATVEYSIAKATPTGEPAYTKITSSGKTLADAALTENFSIPGTVKWVENDGVTELAGTTTVSANTYYKWLFTPTDTDNYETLTGTIKLYSKSSGGGGGVTAYYTVTFETNGGSKVSSKNVTRNTALSEPTAPIKEGYTFKGWYTDKELTTKYNFTAKVTKSLTLYAAWDKIDPDLNRIILTIGNKEAKVFGKTVINDVAPKAVNGRTMLPARFVAESLGAKVDWKESEPDKVVITKGDVVIIITIGANNAIVNDKEFKLESPAFIENNRTYTPIRFISEQLGATVDWE